MKKLSLPLILALGCLFSGCGGSSPAPPVTPPPSVLTPTTTMSVTPATVTAGQHATLTWSSTNTTACSGSGSWSGSQQTSGSLSVTELTSGIYTYNLSCSGAGGAANASANLTVNAPTALIPIPARTAASTCSQNCYYVNANSGSDSNDGLTPATAFQTLQKAANKVVPGSIVTVMSGTYTSATSWSVMELTTTGTAQAWIQFVAGAGQHPVIQLQYADSAGKGIHLNGVAYVVIDGFEVIGQDQAITQGVPGATSSGLLNEECISIDGTTSPTVPHDIIVRNSSIHDCSGSGISAKSTDAVTVAYNRIYNNSWWTVFGESGLNFWHQTDVPGSTTTNGYKNFIVGNLIYNNHNTVPWIAGNPPAIYDGNGIIIDDNQHTQDTGGPNYTKGVPYTGRTYIANNIVYGNGGRGIHVYASAHTDIVNNTAYNNMLTDSPYITVGDIDGQSSYDITIVDNIAVNLNGKVADRNDGNIYGFNVWSGSGVPFLGTNDINGDPQLTNPASGDFSPKPGSAALASGTDALAPSLDYSGRSRALGKIDRGAVQVTN